jgi:hypothetical protein
MDVKESKKQMKYWLYLIAKLAIALGAVCVLQLALAHFYPAPPHPLSSIDPARYLFSKTVWFTLAMLAVIWSIGVGLAYVAIWDQRRRCRTCLKKLIMPIKTGSWGNIVMLGRPTTEMICPFGHGTLYIEDLQITGRRYPDWQPHDDNIWKELESYYQAGK